MKLKYKIWVFIICVIMTIYFSEFSRAESFGISIDKSFLIVDAKAGESFDMYLNVKNIHSTQQKINLSIESYVVEDNNKISFVGKNDINNINNWIFFGSDEIILNADETKEVSVRINVPNSAKEGDYQAILFFSITSKDTEKSINQVGRVGAHILVNVVNSKKYGAGEITEFKVPSFAGDLIEVDLGFLNKGNIYYVPQGNIEIKNIFNSKTLQKKVDEHFVFPGKNFSFKEQLDDFFWFGVYRVEASLVDAEGNFHNKSQYVFGYFFWPLVVLILILIILFLKKKKQ